MISHYVRAIIHKSQIFQQDNECTFGQQKLLRNHTWSSVRKYPAITCALADDLKQHGFVQASFLPQSESLRRYSIMHADHKLIDHFDSLTPTHILPNLIDIRAPDRQQRHAAFTYLVWT